jgi:hypothetical protein
VLTRGVVAAVEVDFGGGVVATWPGPSWPSPASRTRSWTTISTACPMRATRARSPSRATPSARACRGTSWDALPALLTVRDVGGDRAAAYAATGDLPYDRIEALRLDHPQQDMDVYLDLEVGAGVFNCELWSDGSFRGAAGAGLIVQVQASGQVVGYQRLWNSIQTNVPGPVLPPSGRIRLRVRKGAGATTTVHYDLWSGTGFTSDAFVWTVPDDRQFRGQEFALCNYLVNATTRGLKRVTVVPAMPAAPLTIARSPLTSTDDALFQRDAAGLASLTLRLLLRPATAGVVEARVVGSATGLAVEGHDWGAHALTVPAGPDGQRRDLVVAGVPTGGNYDVQVRLLDDASPASVVAQQVLRDVAVGDVFIAAGQSNTSGYSGTFSGAEAPIPEVHLFGNDGRWKPASEPMDDGADQTDLISAENPTIGFQLAFAKALFQATGVPVAMVPSSLGGTNLYAQWQRDPAHPASRITLYGSMLHRARVACPAAPPRGLVWFQGESDAIAGRTQAQYEADLGAFVANARGDLAAPGLVFLCGQLGTYSAANLATWLPVQDAQRRVVAADPFAALATAVDLARPDGIHFDVAGYAVLGRRFSLGARRLLFGHAVDPTDDLLSATAGGRHVGRAAVRGAGVGRRGSALPRDRRGRRGVGGLDLRRGLDGDAQPRSRARRLPDGVVRLVGGSRRRVVEGPRRCGGAGLRRGARRAVSDATHSCSRDREARSPARSGALEHERTLRDLEARAVEAEFDAHAVGHDRIGDVGFGLGFRRFVRLHELADAMEHAQSAFEAAQHAPEGPASLAQDHPPVGRDRDRRVPAGPVRRPPRRLPRDGLFEGDRPARVLPVRKRTRTVEA